MREVIKRRAELSTCNTRYDQCSCEQDARLAIKMKTDREMQLCVVVEHIVGGQLVQLSQHAQAVVGLRFLFSKEERFLCLRRKKM